MTAPLPVPPELAGEPPQPGPATGLPDGIDALLDEIAAARVTRVRRRRQQVADFQTGHLERRRHGLAARHAAKLARLAADTAGTPDAVPSAADLEEDNPQ
ncbi:hypothetical protein [Pseudofrankia inefficax]|uniref:Tetratricopeptide TPR_2 repeat protein n=1 Tax=Pseudofrankia inefficax (strain DSM 45817 / CECT 9037 / DDB 130130 / EuI1c) TaxID=298654 RepID=E3J649_PSEI1|nr:hypothetical protein [Pseudofrankia inefficax]ADP78340.1 tetratricopeptide TPR_2 repeat protein [Pseudofrankia inefficax]